MMIRTWSDAYNAWLRAGVERSEALERADVFEEQLLAVFQEEEYQVSKRTSQLSAKDSP
jgi:hypothetical protein